MRSLLAVPLLLGLSAERADACACCDAQSSRKPVGWNDAGEVLIEHGNNLACEPRKMLEIVPAGANEPTGCYDLYGDPEQKIACADANTPEDPRTKPKKSKQVKRFPRVATKLPAGKVKVTTKPIKDADGHTEALDVTVELDGKQVLTEKLDGVATFMGVTAWPNPKGDRALLLVSHTVQGTGNESVLLRWATLKR